MTIDVTMTFRAEVSPAAGYVRPMTRVKIFCNNDEIYETVTNGDRDAEEAVNLVMSQMMDAAFTGLELGQEARMYNTPL